MDYAQNLNQLQTAWGLLEFPIELRLNIKPMSPLVVTMQQPATDIVAGYCKGDKSQRFTDRNVEAMTSLFECLNLEKCLVMFPPVMNKLHKVKNHTH